MSPFPITAFIRRWSGCSCCNWCVISRFALYSARFAEECELMENNLGNSKCPKCGNYLDGVRVVSYTQSFPCSFCKTELEVPRYYRVVGAWVSFGVSFLLSLSIGLHGLGLLLGFIVFLFPSMFSIGILQRKLTPPKLVVCINESSLFS